MHLKTRITGLQQRRIMLDQQLVYPLKHHYSQAELAFATLKNEDAAAADHVRMPALVTNTVMSSTDDKAALAEAVLHFALGLKEQTPQLATRGRAAATNR